MTPASSAATTLARPWPRVLCRCAAAGLGAELAAAGAVNSRLTCAGFAVAGGVGEADRSAPASASITASPDHPVFGDRPSIVQPNAVEMPTSTRRLAAAGRPSRSAHDLRHLARSPAPASCRCWPAVRRDAETGSVSFCAPAAIARSAPLQVRHQRQHREAGDRRRACDHLGGVGHLRQQLRRARRSRPRSRAGRRRRAPRSSDAWPRSASRA